MLTKGATIELNSSPLPVHTAGSNGCELLQCGVVHRQPMSAHAPCALEGAHDSITVPPCAEARMPMGTTAPAAAI